MIISKVTMFVQLLTYFNWMTTRHYSVENKSGSSSCFVVCVLMRSRTVRPCTRSGTGPTWSSVLGCTGAATSSPTTACPGSQLSCFMPPLCLTSLTAYMWEFPPQHVDVTTVPCGCHSHSYFFSALFSLSTHSLSYYHNMHQPCDSLSTHL